MRLLHYELQIEAPAAVVWEHLTSADGLTRWVGPEAEADPTAGGDLRWMHPDGSTVVGRFLELEPHRRLVFAYGWEDGRWGVVPESTTVEIELTETDGATTLRLTHHGLPPAVVDMHEHGWQYFLGILRDVSAAGT
jgi:uncharacterized protein YndB with AHSA1/START domain